MKRTATPRKSSPAKPATPAPFERGERVRHPISGSDATLVLLETRDALIHVPALPLGERYVIVLASSLVRA